MSDNEDNFEIDEEIICMKCDIKITDSKFALCDSCKRPNHYVCAEISTTEQRSLQLKGKRRLKFFCDDCEKGLSVLPEVLSVVSSLKAEIKSLRESVSGSGCVEAAVDRRAQTHSFQFEEIMEEYAERQQKVKNIIIHKVPESEHRDVTRRQDDDKTKANEIIQSFNRECPPIVMTTRLGRWNGAVPRPMRVVFRDSTMALDILKRKHLYSGPFGITSDKTLQQRNHTRYVRAEVERLNLIEGGQRKTIKYKNGIPKIVNMIESRPKNVTERRPPPSVSTTRT